MACRSQHGSRYTWFPILTLTIVFALACAVVRVATALAIDVAHIADAPGNQSSPDLYGDEVVWVDARDGDGAPDIYYSNLATGESRIVAENQFRAFGPKLSADWIVWGATSSDAPSGVRFQSRSGGESGVVPSLSASFWRFALQGDTVAASDTESERIVVYNLATSARFDVPTGTSPSGARAAFPWIVWAEGDEPRLVVAYNLQTKERRALTDGANSLSAPDISGTRVVWQDVTANAIRMRDLVTGEELTLAAGDGLRQSPSILGDWVVWQDCRNGDFDIFGYYLPTGIVVPLRVAPGNQQDPVLSAQWIAWTDDTSGFTDIDGSRVADIEREYGLSSPSGDTQSVYRFYNMASGSHFYTSSREERDAVLLRWPHVYRYEGTAYSVNARTNKQPLYRFYNERTGSHFYTVSEAERDVVIQRWPDVFVYEGTAFSVSSAPTYESREVYRFYNLANGSHFYTSSAVERDNVIGRWPNIYTYEGVAFWLAR